MAAPSRRSGFSRWPRTSDPKKYGARIWLEHYRGIAPDGLFKAYGDVLALEAREVEGGKLALFAQKLNRCPSWWHMTKAKQKIYTPASRSTPALPTRRGLA